MKGNSQQSSSAHSRSQSQSPSICFKLSIQLAHIPGCGRSEDKCRNLEVPEEIDVGMDEPGAVRGCLADFG